MPYKLRKRLYDDVLVNYSLKLRPDQIQDLKKLKDAAGLIRTWIDEGLARELGKGEDPVSMSKRITALQAEITRLHDSPEYVRARDIRKEGVELYLKIIKLFDGKNCFLVFNGNIKELYVMAPGIMGQRIMLEANGVYAPGWTTKSLTEYLNDNSVESTLPPELSRAVVSKMIEAYPAEVKVAEGYERQIEALKAEVEGLRKKLTG